MLIQEVVNNEKETYSCVLILFITSRALVYASTDDSLKRTQLSSCIDKYVLDTESLFEYSAGGIYSTVGDLYTWQNALFGGKLISLSSVSKMMISYFNTYGYGLIISKNAVRDKLVGHNGSLPGYSTYIEKNMD